MRLGLYAAMKYMAAISFFSIFFCNNLHAHAGHDEQLRQVNLAIEQNPKEQSLYIRRGAVYTEAQQFSLAESDFAIADSLGPHKNTAYHRGQLYYQMEDLQRALHYLAQHIQQHPDSAAGYELRARVWRDKGEPTRAIADLRKNLKLLKSPHPGNYIAAAELLEQVSATDSALELLDEGLARLGITPQIQRKAIELEQSRGNTAGAMERMKSLGAALRNNPKWKIEMAAMLLTAHETDKANTLLRNALDELSEQRATPARAALKQEALELLAKTKQAPR